MRSKAAAIVAIALVGTILVLPATSHAWRGGWYGPGVFAGGVLLGAAIAGPWYGPPPAYYYPAPQPVYAYPPPPAYAYPPAPAQTYAPPPPPDAGPPSQAASRGQWVEVPGQTVNNLWVPSHKVWVADN